MRETSHKRLFAERRRPTNIAREPLLEHHRALKNLHRIYVEDDSLNQSRYKTGKESKSFKDS